MFLAPMLASEINGAAQYLNQGGDPEQLQEQVDMGRFEDGQVPSTFYQHLTFQLLQTHPDILSNEIQECIESIQGQQRKIEKTRITADQVLIDAQFHQADQQTNVCLEPEMG